MSSIKTQHLRAGDALSFIAKEKNVQEWQQLALEQKGYSRMQEAEILCTWYKYYSTAFEPVIFISHDETDQLVGFIGMVWDEKSQELKHAGHPEYHGWLAKPEHEIHFLKNVFRLVRDNFSLKKLFWNILPPGFSIDNFRAALDKNMFLTLKKRVSPIWDLTDNLKLEKLLKRRSNRSKLNRYRRRGNLDFEIIKESSRLREVFQIVKNQINFRHEAVNNVQPFINDPLKIDHFCEQIKTPNSVLPAALWLDNQLLAFQLGIVSGDYISLRMISFDPSEFKQSPGTLSFVKLGEYLTEQGFKTYDLTPGLNTYKDRFSNVMVDLVEPTIHFSRASFQKELIKKRIINNSRKLLIDKLGININRTRKWKRDLAELPQKFKSFRESKTRLNLKEEIPFLKKPNLIHLKPNEINFSPVNSNLIHLIKSQQYEDLLKYQDTSPFLTRRGLLIDAQNKFAKGEILYSIANEKKLLWYIWQKKVKGEINLKNQSFPIQEEGVLLYDCYQSSDLEKEKFSENISDLVPHLNIKEVENIYLLESTFNNGS